MRNGVDKTIPFDARHNTERISRRPANSPEMNVMQRRNGRKKTIDPFGYIVFFYVILNLFLFSLFGWLYYSLDRKVVKLSDQLAAYQQRDAQSDAYHFLPEKAGAESPPPVQAGANEQNNSAVTASKSTAYTVESGDTWWDICQRFYGDGTYYHKLLVYNKLKKEDLIRGLVIQIPAKEELSTQ